MHYSINKSPRRDIYIQNFDRNITELHWTVTELLTSIISDSIKYKVYFCNPDLFKFRSVVNTIQKCNVIFNANVHFEE